MAKRKSAPKLTVRMTYRPAPFGGEAGRGRELVVCDGEVRRSAKDAR